jgi:orotidine-5'-phosphate decarboxylase
MTTQPTHYTDQLTAAIAAKKTPAVVGIDPVIEKLPAALQPRENTLTAAVRAVETFCRGVIDAVANHVPAVKINAGFFEAMYGEGLAAYYRTVAHAHANGLLVIGDIKRGDIGSTAQLYARGHLDAPTFDDMDPTGIPDAVTLAGYLGENAVRAFIDVARRTGRGMYVLVRPSEPKADLVHEFGEGARFYQHMARLVDQWGSEPDLLGESGLSCVGAVVAAKDAESTAALRESLPRTPFLVPGYGAQGGTADDCRPCFRADGTGAVINASRSVIYAFSQVKYAEQHGDDWPAAVAAAAQVFAADVGPLLR